MRDSSLFAIYRDLTRIIQLIALITIISTVNRTGVIHVPHICA